MVNVKWVYDENKNFDSHSLNPNGRPWVWMVDNNIDV